ncbi:putative ABC transport system ATP-binding protein [Anaerosphaera aminiphila DSM 21120]|uniref:Putative ABC transport system ATP-binding protein n=1 Tax=Anaerosphaera aminiphila DSM 21120 TaxID=1120995 RepID=A0A1M5TGJ9_9FIRM|nr:putative ABC transport system ATP-binding protein [Anaerosphaera aminiphila DSM 21120]
MLEGIGLKKYYGKGESLVKALDGVDIEIRDGEFISIIGTSGSGKSTLLHLLGGLDNPTEGKIILDGKDYSKLKQDELTILRRRHIGFVFQSYNLLKLMNVYENITLPVGLDGNTVKKDYIDEILSVLGISDKKYAMPNELSGGQQQRVAIARALASNPSIILADEPTGNLDRKSGKAVMDLFTKVNETFQKSIVVISHDEEVAQRAERILHIEDGRFI